MYCTLTLFFQKPLVEIIKLETAQSNTTDVRAPPAMHELGCTGTFCEGVAVKTVKSGVMPTVVDFEE